MDIAVTGAAGFLGRNLTSWLAVRREHRVLGFDRDDGWPALAAGLDQADFVFHLAGVNRPEHDQEFVAGNVELTEQICDHLLRRRRPVPLLLSSSIQAGLDNPYGRSKAAAEAAVAAYACAERRACLYLPARQRLWQMVPPQLSTRWSPPSATTSPATSPSPSRTPAAA